MQIIDHPLEINMATDDVQPRVNLSEFPMSVNDHLLKLRRKIRQHFNIRVAPSDNIILNIIARFERTGDLPGSDSKQTMRINAWVETVQQSVL